MKKEFQRTDVTERFLTFYDHLVHTKQIRFNKDLIQKVGLSNSSMSEIIKNRSNVGVDFIKRVAETYKELNVDWLIMGRGEMLNSGVKKNDSNDDSSSLFETLKDTKERVNELKETISLQRSEIERLRLENEELKNSKKETN